MWEERKLIKHLYKLEDTNGGSVNKDVLIKSYIHTYYPKMEDEKRNEFHSTYTKIERLIEAAIADKYVTEIEDATIDNGVYLKTTVAGRRFRKIEWYLRDVTNEFGPLKSFIGGSIATGVVWFVTWIIGKF